MKIRFGIFSDLHYSLPGAEIRGNSAGTLDDLRQGMEYFVNSDASFAVNLGDSDQPVGDPQKQYDLLKYLNEVWSGYGIPVHTSFGNHEFCDMTLESVTEILGMHDTYYAFDAEDIRFLIMDSCFNPDGTHFSMNNFDWQKGMIPPKETEWLRKMLASGKRTFIFTHYNFCFESQKDDPSSYLVQNHREIREILEDSRCVEAVFQGHHHTSEYYFRGGIPYFNIPSPERSDGFHLSDFPLVEVTDDGFIYDGKPYFSAPRDIE